MDTRPRFRFGHLDEDADEGSDVIAHAEPIGRPGPPWECDPCGLPNIPGELVACPYCGRPREDDE